ncbi:hypothetical protein [Spiroplasma ixodetis]|uniref:Uncharacterized protein n=1 Tax=Spiroplasma ixodetis TaxID=2141 RepID=A0ABM8JQR6_9MOLU
MKYFSLSYWFKLWVLSAPLFNDKTQGINAKSIDNNQKIKDWASNNTNLQSINQYMAFTNSSTNYQPYNLNQQVPNQNIDPFYQTELETSTHKHRHEKSRIIKRGANSDRENAIEFKQDIFGGYINGEIYASFTPKFWEEVSYLKITSNNKEKFIQSFKNKVTSGVWKDYRLEGVNDPSYKAMLGLGSSIWDNWININNVWQKSSKNKMIRVEIKTWYQSGDRQFSFLNSHIRGDSVILSNPYLETLKRDFPDYDNAETVNLGNILMTYSDSIVKETLKRKYRNFDINQISIVNNENFSHLCQCFKFKIRVNGDSKHYSYGDLKPTFSYITTSKLNELSNIIANNPKAKQWIEHINEWSSSLSQTNYQIPSSQNQQVYVSKSGYTLEELRNNKYNFDFQQAQINYQINQNLNDYTKAQQRFVQAQNDYISHIQQGQPLLSFTNQQIISRPQTMDKVIQKEILKGYIRDWSYVSTLVENELKLDELNKNVQGIKSSFDIIKNQVNELEQRISNLEKSNNCEKYGYVVAGTSGVVALAPIPGLQQLAVTVSAFSAAFASLCNL